MFFEMGGKSVFAAAGKVDPPRLACFYIPGAIAPREWYPKDTGLKYTIAASHKPLEKHRDQFSLLTGLSHIEGRISGHPHAYNWLTGHNINLTPGTKTNTVSMNSDRADGSTGLAKQRIAPHSRIRVSVSGE